MIVSWQFLTRDIEMSLLAHWVSRKLTDLFHPKRNQLYSVDYYVTRNESRLTKAFLSRSWLCDKRDQHKRNHSYQQKPHSLSKIVPYAFNNYCDQRICDRLWLLIASGLRSGLVGALYKARGDLPRLQGRTFPLDLWSQFPLSEYQIPSPLKSQKVTQKLHSGPPQACPASCRKTAKKCIIEY